MRKMIPLLKMIPPVPGLPLYHGRFGAGGLFCPKLYRFKVLQFKV